MDLWNLLALLGSPLIGLNLMPDGLIIHSTMDTVAGVLEYTQQLCDNQVPNDVQFIQFQPSPSLPSSSPTPAATQTPSAPKKWGRPKKAKELKPKPIAASPLTTPEPEEIGRFLVVLLVLQKDKQTKGRKVREGVKVDPKTYGLVDVPLDATWNIFLEYVHTKILKLQDSQKSNQEKLIYLEMQPPHQIQQQEEELLPWESHSTNLIQLIVMNVDQPMAKKAKLNDDIEDLIHEISDKYAPVPIGRQKLSKSNKNLSEQNLLQIVLIYEDAKANKIYKIS
ncbi:hypothetical protein BT96DRAFT_945742 [Gymnopus androsaceus JB14]|uniref:Uncharacterized protein n=1 Tax=Gymnopus androsaceus JB14 TaxID=1447944 RepID=A0A6A4GZS8_9AGAR|nr:hypothetical protein BT96DRAFT_945742 [Gymnopus androsaceus JB14]